MHVVYMGVCYMSEDRFNFGRSDKNNLYSDNGSRVCVYESQGWASGTIHTFTELMSKIRHVHVSILAFNAHPRPIDTKEVESVGVYGGGATGGGAPCDTPAGLETTA